MERTGLGLTKIDPGESPWSDGGSFFGRNQDILDHLVRLGALTHRHDSHAPLVDPTTAPGAVSSATGGTLPSDTPISVGFTAIDDQGGETLLSPAVVVDTPPPAGQPAATFTGTPSYIAGNLPAGTYYYALTATDGAGGETPASDPVQVVIAAGHANGQVQLAGLTTAIAGAAGWRLYRSANGGAYGLLASGNTDAYTDDCSDCADTTLPPPDDLGNSAAATASVSVTVPAADLPAGATSYRIYASVDPSFPNPSLVGEFAAADAGTAHVVTTLVLEPGQPPAVSTSVGGAAKITLADLAADVTAELGGGGGSAGPFTRLIEGYSSFYGFGNWGPTEAEYLAAGLLWRVDPSIPQFLLYSRLHEGAPTYGTEIPDAPGYASWTVADWSGDTGAFTFDGPGGNVLHASGATGVDHSVFNGSASPPYTELDYNIVSGAGWDRIFVAQMAGDQVNGIALVMDRAAGELQLVNFTSRSPFIYTVLASIGAAEGWTPPGSGTVGRLTMRQENGTVWAVNLDASDNVVGAPIVFTLPPELVVATYPMFGGNWNAANAWDVTYFGSATFPDQAYELVATQVYASSPPQDPAGASLDLNAPTIVLVSTNGFVWTAATLAGTWTNTVGGQPLEFRQVNDTLELRGAIEGGAAGDTITTLPNNITPPSSYVQHLGPISVHPDRTVVAEAAGPLVFNVRLSVP